MEEIKEVIQDLENILYDLREGGDIYSAIDNLENAIDNMNKRIKEKENERKRI